MTGFLTKWILNTDFSRCAFMLFGCRSSQPGTQAVTLSRHGKDTNSNNDKRVLIFVENLFVQHLSI